ncbi:DNA-binding transcriptional LysR family regulator [Inquilinus ginsengisoli]|uniref:DNA-binding transcriptional LysR family regulator n=1 Tax=Inquilinus ginsengisoli TaxID=363840 RepID=A0ABU1JML2_9PROT|nr:LysR family transcriptional regulator [Inquilinus ginsengisoli]MDR6288799.1 DNA-binding transcriptional LysR family regulator [Inquilinus ginsengisoli]
MDRSIGDHNVAAVSAMLDLNDLRLFAKVAQLGGFTAAGRALGLPKSRLSRRIAGLEDQLGVRLLQRSTRRLSLTDVGESFLRRCETMLAEAEAAEQAVAQARSEPSGLIRITCPHILAQTMIAPLINSFLAAHPAVRIAMELTGRRVDVIEERVDLAFRVRRPPTEPSDVVVRVLSQTRGVVVAAPALLDRLGRPLEPVDLIGLGTLDLHRADGRHSWTLADADGGTQSVPHVPRLATDDMFTLRQAAVDGLGAALLPDYICRPAIQAGQLEHILLDWRVPEGEVQAVFASRRGLVPAVRALVDHVVRWVPRMVAICDSELPAEDVLPPYADSGANAVALGLDAMMLTARAAPH